MSEYLWYIPNIVEPGHRGDDTRDGWGSIEYSTDLARTAEQHGWGGALLGTGWGRPDTFTVATALAARTATFKPLIAICPGYWQPAHFASAAATLDQLSPWLVGSADDVAFALQKYRSLSITHFVLSDRPYKPEIARIGDELLPLLRTPAA